MGKQHTKVQLLSINDAEVMTGYEFYIRTYALTEVTPRLIAIFPTPPYGRQGHNNNN